MMRAADFTEAFSLYVFKTLYIIFDKKTLRKNDIRSRTYFIVTHYVKSAKCFLISDFTNTENLAKRFELMVRGKPKTLRAVKFVPIVQWYTI